ncbi:MAG: glucokinase [Crocosphaera sp.]|nr:glucokinase [Crocosphaera sp.]
MYLTGYIASENIKFGVFNPTTQKIVYKRTPDLSKDFDLEKMLLDFLDGYKGYLQSLDEKLKPANGGIIQYTVIAAGGPTGGEKLTISHLGSNITIKVEDIGKAMKRSNSNYSSRVSLLNDFESLGYGILFCDDNGFPKSDFRAINGTLKDMGRERDDKIITQRYLDKQKKYKSLILGPDKGLGMAGVPYGVEWNGLPYIETSEGGHGTFSPEWEDAVNLVQYIQKVQSNEDFLSHRGIQEIYNYFLFEKEYSPNYKLSYREIIANAFGGNDNPAVSTVRFICEAVGALCGNMANIFNCNQSIFLWSETLQEIRLPFLKHHFQRRFSARPRHGETIGKLPVLLIDNNEFPLYGCAYYAVKKDRGTPPTEENFSPVPPTPPFPETLLNPEEENESES